MNSVQGICSLATILELGQGGGDDIISGAVSQLWSGVILHFTAFAAGRVIVFDGNETDVPCCWPRKDG